jgi:hypothetical protein
MGGYGSSRWGYPHRPRPVAEQSLAWPIATLRDAIAHYITNGGGGRWTIHWSQHDQPVAAVNVTVIAQSVGLAVVVDYMLQGQPVHDVISLITTPSNLPDNSGRRYWWRCPCGRRVGVLYNPGWYWRCRHCHNITYTSSNQSDKRVSRLLAGGRNVLDQLDAALAPDPTLGAREVMGWLRHTRPLLHLLLKAERLAEQRASREHRRTGDTDELDVVRLLAEVHAEVANAQRLVVSPCREAHTAAELAPRRGRRC